MLGKVFERFVEKAPVAVMVRGTLARILSPQALDALFERVADRQYTRELLFCSVFQLMSLVVCRVQPGIHAAYQDNKEAIMTSMTAVHDKLNGIDTVTSGALVEETAEQRGAAVREMSATRIPWLPGQGVGWQLHRGDRASAQGVTRDRQGCITGEVTGHLRARAGDGDRGVCV
jgi:hypothetical protein